MDALQEYLTTKFRRAERRLFEFGRKEIVRNSKRPDPDHSSRILKRDYYTCGYCGMEGGAKTMYAHVVLPSVYQERYNLPFTIVEDDRNTIAACKPCKREKEKVGLEEFFYRHPDRLKHLTEEGGSYTYPNILEAVKLIADRHRRKKEAEKLIVGRTVIFEEVNSVEELV